MWKITIEQSFKDSPHLSSKVSRETYTEEFSDLLEEILNLCVAAGFHTNSIERSVMELAEIMEVASEIYD